LSGPKKSVSQFIAKKEGKIRRKIDSFPRGQLSADGGEAHAGQAGGRGFMTHR
jgi:hypothetical protein